MADLKMSTFAYDRFKLITFSWMRSIGRCLGHNILRIEYRINAIAMSMSILSAIATSLYIWTIYRFDGELALKSLSILGVCFKVIAKAMLPLAARSNINRSVEFLAKIYEQNSKTAEHELILRRFASILTIAAQLVVANYSVGSLGILMSPAAIYCFYGTYDVILPVVVPGTTLDTASEYAINLMVQAATMVYSCLVFIFCDLLFVVQMLHVILMVAILCQKITIIDGVTESRASQVEIKLNMKNMIDLHNDLRW